MNFFKSHGNPKNKTRTTPYHGWGNGLKNGKDFVPSHGAHKERSELSSQSSAARKEKDSFKYKRFGS